MRHSDLRALPQRSGAAFVGTLLVLVAVAVAAWRVSSSQSPPVAEAVPTVEKPEVHEKPAAQAQQVALAATPAPPNPPTLGPSVITEVEPKSEASASAPVTGSKSRLPKAAPVVTASPAQIATPQIATPQIATPQIATPQVPSPVEKPQGIVSLNCTPVPCSVDLDGTAIGETPKLGLKLSAGDHEVRFVNLETGAVTKRRFEVKSGETTTVGQRL